MTLLPAPHQYLLYSSYVEAGGHVMSRLQQEEEEEEEEEDDGGGYEYCSSLGSDLVVNNTMGEDESTTQTTGNQTVAAGDDIIINEAGWLQLSIGDRHHTTSPTPTPEFIELNLLPPPPPPSPTGGSSSFPQEINWMYMPPPMMMPLRPPPPPSSSSSFMPPAAYFSSRPMPFRVQPPPGLNLQSGTGIDFRVIDPPRRPHSGIWFMLQASQNQGREPLLPQIPNTYLRIKDGRMTIRLVIKYLVNKLSLLNESEVEIRCRGEVVVPLLTLQHVRDNLWNLTNPSSHHVMVLHYGRTTAAAAAAPDYYNSLPY